MISNDLKSSGTFLTGRKFETCKSNFVPLSIGHFFKIAFSGLGVFGVFGQNKSVSTKLGITSIAVELGILSLS